LNDKCEIPGMDEFNEFGLVFLGKNYFAIPSDMKEESDDEDSDDCEDNNDKGFVKKEKKIEDYHGYSIHRLSDGIKLCFLPNNNDFKFLRNSTKGINEGALVTGILDIRTGRVYDCNIRTILHLGAKSLHLNRTDKILKNELNEFVDLQIKEFRLNNESTHILSLQAPGLFF
jgi:hypothetical protein